MIISTIEAENFRNYKHIKVELNKNKNIFYGKNAQGKTNLLEAVYLCSITKSHRTSKDSEMIKVGEEKASVKTNIIKDGENYKININIKNGKNKEIIIGNNNRRKSADVLGILKTVLFSPEDLDIIKRGPEYRRKFIDIELCQIDKVYLNDLSLYKKILNQRNRLLKDIYHNRSLMDLLYAWDEKLLYHGKRIIEKRNSFIEEIYPNIYKKHKKLSSGEEIKIYYEPNVEVVNLSNKLSENIEKDIKNGNTSVGPHKDDIGFSIKDMDIRKYGSQGQQRSAALSLKLSEIDIIKEKTGENPVLLLDDVLSELDRNRQTQLIENLEDVQTIITCTGIDDILEKNFNSCNTFMVENANIKLIKETED